MIKPSLAFTLVASGLALAACNPPDPNRTTKAPPAVDHPTAVMQPLVTPSAPAAPTAMGPIPPSANHAAPGTNAELAFAQEENITPAPPAKAKPIAPVTQEVAVNAQEAAAKAPDTAAADAAKDEVKADGAKADTKADETEDATGKRMPGTAQDTPANSPRHGTLTDAEESTQMPKAGQANNYSSPALEKDSGR